MEIEIITPYKPGDLYVVFSGDPRERAMRATKVPFKIIEQNTLPAPK